MFQPTYAPPYDFGRGAAKQPVREMLWETEDTMFMTDEKSRAGVPGLRKLEEVRR
jgi:hypothetical protein